MRSYRNILIASAVIMAAVACTKNTPDGPDPITAPISISATEGATKALLDNGSFKTTPGTKALIESEDEFAKDGNRIQVYSYANGGYYFSDMIGPDVQGSPAAMGTAGVWPFVNGPHNWTSGTHRFYGWLTKDANSNLGPEDLFGDSFNCVTANKNVTVAAFNTDTQTLTIPTTTMSPSAPQFDFMYSNIFTTEPINSPVQLEFSHLFSAISFGLKNETSATVTLTNLQIKLYNEQGAEISFAGNQPSVQYLANTTSGTSTFFSSNTSRQLAPSGNATSSLANLISGTNSKEYLLVWPHSADMLKDCSIYLEYQKNYGSGPSQEWANLKFPDKMEAGKRYHYTITIQERADVTIGYIVTEWSTNNIQVPDFN